MSRFNVFHFFERLKILVNVFLHIFSQPCANSSMEFLASVTWRITTHDVVHFQLRARRRTCLLYVALSTVVQAAHTHAVTHAFYCTAWRANALFGAVIPHCSTMQHGAEATEEFELVSMELDVLLDTYRKRVFPGDWLHWYWLPIT